MVIEGESHYFEEQPNPEYLRRRELLFAFATNERKLITLGLLLQNPDKSYGKMAFQKDIDLLLEDNSQTYFDGNIARHYCQESFLEKAIVIKIENGYGLNPDKAIQQDLISTFNILTPIAYDYSFIQLFGENAEVTYEVLMSLAQNYNPTTFEITKSQAKLESSLGKHHASISNSIHSLQEVGILKRGEKREELGASVYTYVKTIPHQLTRVEAESLENFFSESIKKMRNQNQTVAIFNLLDTSVPLSTNEIAKKLQEKYPNASLKGLATAVVYACKYWREQTDYIHVDTLSRLYLNKAHLSLFTYFKEIIEPFLENKYMYIALNENINKFMNNKQRITSILQRADKISLFTGRPTAKKTIDVPVSQHSQKADPIDVEGTFLEEIIDTIKIKTAHKIALLLQLGGLYIIKNRTIKEIIPEGDPKLYEPENQALIQNLQSLKIAAPLKYYPSPFPHYFLEENALAYYIDNEKTLSEGAKKNCRAFLRDIAPAIAWISEEGWNRLMKELLIPVTTPPLSKILKGIEDMQLLQGEQPKGVEESIQRQENEFSRNIEVEYFKPENPKEILESLNYLFIEGNTTAIGVFKADLIQKRHIQNAFILAIASSVEKLQELFLAKDLGHLNKPIIKGMLSYEDFYFDIEEYGSNHRYMIILNERYLSAPAELALMQILKTINPSERLISDVILDRIDLFKKKLPELYKS